MTTLSITRLTLAAMATLSLLAVTGCGDDEGATATQQPVRTSQAAATPEVVEPLPLIDHVLTALPGFDVDDQARVVDLATFAEEHHKTVSELRRSGMVEAAVISFAPLKGNGFAMSIAASYNSPAQARAEAERLFASNSEPDPGTTAEFVDVPGHPEIQAVRLSGKQRGEFFTGTEIVFVDGTVMHEVFAFGVDPIFDLDAVLDIVGDLQTALAGRPLGRS